MWKKHISLRDWDLGELDDPVLTTIRSELFVGAETDNYPVTKEDVTLGVVGAYARGQSTYASLPPLFQGALRFNHQFATSFRVDLPSPGLYRIAAGTGATGLGFARGSFAFLDGDIHFHSSPNLRTTGNQTDTRAIDGTLQTFGQFFADMRWVEHEFQNDHLVVRYITDSYIQCVLIEQLGGDVIDNRRRHQTSGGAL